MDICKRYTTTRGVWKIDTNAKWAAPGKYKAIMMSDGGYKILAEKTFEIKLSQNVELNLDKTNYKQGDIIQLGYEGTRGDDWIGGPMSRKSTN